MSELVREQHQNAADVQAHLGLFGSGQEAYVDDQGAIVADPSQPDPDIVDRAPAQDQQQDEAILAEPAGIVHPPHYVREAAVSRRQAVAHRLWRYLLSVEVDAQGSVNDVLATQAAEGVSLARAEPDIEPSLHQMLVAVQAPAKAVNRLPAEQKQAMIQSDLPQQIREAVSSVQVSSKHKQTPFVPAHKGEPKRLHVSPLSQLRGASERVGSWFQARWSNRHSDESLVASTDAKPTSYLQRQAGAHDAGRTSILELFESENRPESPQVYIGRHLAAEPLESQPTTERRTPSTTLTTLVTNLIANNIAKERAARKTKLAADTAEYDAAVKAYLETGVAAAQARHKARMADIERRKALGFDKPMELPARALEEAEPVVTPVSQAPDSHPN